MSYPNEQLPAGRPLRMAGAHDAMAADGARWGDSWGMEVPHLFRAEGLSGSPTLKRSNAFDLVGEESRKVRKGVGVIDISAFSRYEVSGPNAQGWLDQLLACRIPAPGRAQLAPMLRPNGKLKGDLTVFNWGERTLVDHRILLPPAMAYALVRDHLRRTASPCATSPTRWSASPSPGRTRASCCRA